MQRYRDGALFPKQKSLDASLPSLIDAMMWIGALGELQQRSLPVKNAGATLRNNSSGSHDLRSDVEQGFVVKLSLEQERWYGWQMLPGYAEDRAVPFFSPIFVREVVPRKTGQGVLRLRFMSALYAEGVQDLVLDLRVLKHTPEYLVGELLYDGNEPSNRVAIVSHIEFEWLRRFCPDLLAASPRDSFGPVEQGSVSRYLDAVFPALRGGAG